MYSTDRWIADRLLDLGILAVCAWVVGWILRGLDVALRLQEGMR